MRLIHLRVLAKHVKKKNLSIANTGKLEEMINYTNSLGQDELLVDDLRRQNEILSNAAKNDERKQI